MASDQKPLRVVYSFPHKLGAQRICLVAWQQVTSLAAAGAEITAFPGVLARNLPATVKVRPTLAWGKLRLPYSLLGRARACGLHDAIVASRLRRMAGQVDIVHTWPLGAERTLRAAAKLGIPTVLERPNAHTRFAYKVVEEECQRLGLSMPDGHEHAFNAEYLKKEEDEYNLADGLLCPSDFVVKTFADMGFDKKKLLRHQYGFDEKVSYHTPRESDDSNGLTVLFAGGCAPRKGLHYALEAWIRSPASKSGKFLIVGEFIPGYAEKLSEALSHPSVSRLGYRKDLSDVMRQSDILVLPSIEEGSALVTSDARACGCVLVVSEAAGAICTHMENALVHQPGDVGTLGEHITLLHNNRMLLKKMRAASLATVDELTWKSAAGKLLQAYRTAVVATRNN